MNADPHTADTPIVFDPDAGEGLQYTELTEADLHLPYYPFTYLLSSGKVVTAGSNYFDSRPPAEPYHTRTLQMFFPDPPDPAVGEWTIIEQSAIKGGSAVMFRPDTILMAGGGTTGLQGPHCGDFDPTSAARVLDMSGNPPTWQPVAPMNSARYHFYLIVLPDGKVLAVGGYWGQGPQIPQETCDQWVSKAEMYDPDTDTWSRMRGMAVPRLYHSSAVLLPDARVLVAGGDHPSPQTSAQIYSPPYLFQGSRPEFVNVPQLIQYAKAFAITTSIPIQEVCLIRLGSATHSLDFDQRYVPLSRIVALPFNRYLVPAPAHAFLAPPGYYMLFVLANGVPSEAAIVKLE